MPTTCLIYVLDKLANWEYSLTLGAGVGWEGLELISRLHRKCDFSIKIHGKAGEHELD